MKVDILYKTDKHHSFASRDVIGVFTNHKLLKSTCKELIRDNLADTYTEADLLKGEIEYIHNFLFSSASQTQGLIGFELVIEEIETNTLI